MFTVDRQRDETPSTKTVRFKEPLDARPGQFVMVWVPGVDEFPMSVSYPGMDFGVTYQIVGEGTKALAQRLPGERIGIRGPYGNGYTLEGRKVLAVAGGTGTASLAPFIESAVKGGAAVTAVLGAKTSKDLLFEDRCARAGATVRVSTDDGSKGFKGLATDLARKTLDAGRFDAIYTCGPERMVAGLVPLARRHNIGMFASLERLMKCGIGICDSCALDGLHVCRDGPVFPLDVLERSEEFGRTRLDPTGTKVPI